MIDICSFSAKAETCCVLRRFSSAIFLVALFSGIGAFGQINLSVNLPPVASFCDTVRVTNRIQNTGVTLDQLRLTNSLPGAGYAYVTNNSVLRLPGGIVLTNSAAEPLSYDGTNLVWDFSAVITPSGVDHLIISEVYYDAAVLPEEPHEWFEIYNPTASNVVATGWSMRDALPGQTDNLPDFTIAPGEFVIVTGSTNAFFSTYPAYVGTVIEVADGALGSGLNNFADGVFLLNSSASTVDAVSYGGSAAGLSPPVPDVAEGHSIARNPTDQDNNSRSDWADLSTPTPGTGAFLTGIGNGAVIEVVYDLELPCGVAAGDLFSGVSFRQPAGGPIVTDADADFLTIEPADLVIQKSPLRTPAGFGDTVVWTVRVENAGFGDADNVLLVDNLGGGFNFVGFSVDPVEPGPHTTLDSVSWDSTVIPELAVLGPQDFVEILVTGVVVSCNRLFNKVDAQFGCEGLLAATNAICENTVSEGETAGSGIVFVPRYPEITKTIVPEEFLSLDYCTGGVVSVTVTNRDGANVGPARSITFTPDVPEGYTLIPSCPVVDGQVLIGDLEAGESTNVFFTIIPGGSCPLPNILVPIYCESEYLDACSNRFEGEPVVLYSQITNRPSARVSKIMPTSVSGVASSLTVQVLFEYENFLNQTVTITDDFPSDSFFTAQNITQSGVLDTPSTSVTWTPTLSGSGVFTGAFDLVWTEACNVPNGFQLNQVFADDYEDCQGCTRSVLGDGSKYYFEISPFGCPGGDPGGCSFSSSKLTPQPLVEVCEGNLLTHRFSNLQGTLPISWDGVFFTSDLAEGQGFLTSTNRIAVRVDTTDVTPFITIVSESPNLVLSFTNLASSSYPDPSTVTGTIEVVWEVAVPDAGEVFDNSSLTFPPCGNEGDIVTWNVGQSRMNVSLYTMFGKDACGVFTGRIDIAQLNSPLANGAAGLFPDYDVELVLDLDAEGDGFASYDYIAGSAVFSNLTDLGGSPLVAFDPTISPTQLVWNLGDLGVFTNGAVEYLLQSSCTWDTNERHSAYLRYNTLCDAGFPPTKFVSSISNKPPRLFSAYVDNFLNPQVQFLQTTNLFLELALYNFSGSVAYNVKTDLVFPTNVFFATADVLPASQTATNAIFDFQVGGAGLGFIDADGDGFFDDLPPSTPVLLNLLLTVNGCESNEISVSTTHGCKGEVCDVSSMDLSEFIPLRGGLVTRTEFPATTVLCETNAVKYSIRNSGLTENYFVAVRQSIPDGVLYVSGSGGVSFNNGPTNSIADPIGSGTILDMFEWDSAVIGGLSALQPNDEISIVYDVFVDCDSVGGTGTFRAQGEFTDTCGIIITNDRVDSVLLADRPFLNMVKRARNESQGETAFNINNVIADVGDTVVYQLEISHTTDSEAEAKVMEVQDFLPADLVFGGASLPPDAIVGNTLIWSNETLNSLVGDGLPPFTQAESTFSILITSTVTTCSAAIHNDAALNYGCSLSCLDLSDTIRQTIRTEPLVSSTAQSKLVLSSCGGTHTLVITNTGATMSALVFTNTAPPGYIYSDASVSGELIGSGLTLTLGGSGPGSTSVLDLRTTASSGGAVDVDDDAGDGIINLDLGENDSITVVYTLVSDGSTLDCLADPTDLDFLDPEQGDPSPLSVYYELDYRNNCGIDLQLTGSQSALPEIPDPDIDVQPNSVIVSNGQSQVFTVTINNNSETANAENLHARIRFDSGWTNLEVIATNLVESGTGSVQTELQGSSNVIVELPGVILDSIDDFLVLTFRAVAVEGAGGLRVRGEIVGDCEDPNILNCTPLNIFAEPPFADTFSGVLSGPVLGQYYSFDQDESYAAGFIVYKTVRYDEEPPPGGDFRLARIGEDLIYRIHARFFGSVFSDTVIQESLPANLDFGTPVDIGSSATISNNWVFNPATGDFTLPSPLTNDELFWVDIPVIVSNQAMNVDGVSVTNAATAVFDVVGVTNVPPVSETVIDIIEPNLVISKTSGPVSDVQAGDIVIFTNTLVHSPSSSTTAYDVVFSDTLPAGLTFSGIDLATDGIDNDGDGVADGADAANEASLVSGNTLSVSTNDNSSLGVFEIGDQLEVVFPARVLDQLIGRTLTNGSQAVYTSLDGVATNLNERTGDDGPGGLNDYSTSDSTPLGVSGITNLTKVLISTSQANTADPAVTIGERLVYRIRVDMPQGVVTNAVLLDAIPAGFDFVGANDSPGMTYPGYGYAFSVPSGGPVLDTNAVVVIDPDPTPTNSVNLDGSGDDITFQIGTITNAPDADPNNDYFDLFLEVVVLDEAINDGIIPGVYSNRNTATYSDSYNSAFTGSPYSTIADINLIANKSFSPDSGDAGDVISIELQAVNNANALANAYDVVLTDFLSSNLYDVATFTPTLVPVGWSLTSVGTVGGILVYFESDPATALPPNTTETAQFSITLSQGLRPNQVFTNVVDITGDTIDGVQPGGMPDGESSDSGSDLFSVPNLEIVKSLFATSETGPGDSTNDFVQIGEVLTYELEITLPETSITNLTIVESIPAGLAYVHTSAVVDVSGFVGSLGVLSESPSPSGPALAGDGQDVTFIFNGESVVTGVHGTSNNTFSLFFECSVLDVPLNNGLTGTQNAHTNTANMTYSGNPKPPVNAGTVVTKVVEPRIEITKEIVQTLVDAGDLLNMDLVITNSGLATAYDLEITDPLNTNAFVFSSIVPVTVPTGFVFTSSNDAIYVRSDPASGPLTNSLEAGESLLVQFTVVKSDFVPPNVVFTNQAIVTAGDTIYGDDPYNEQRDKSGANDLDTVLVGDFLLSKTLIGSSETDLSDSTSTNVQIGEVVSYEISTTLPEGQTTDLLIRDLVPPGMAYVSGSLVVDTSSFAGTLAPVTNITPVSVPLGGDGEDVEITFVGKTQATANNNSADDRLTIRLDLVVLDTNSVIGLSGSQSILPNKAEIDYFGNPAPPATSTVVNVIAVEPLLGLSKSIDLASGDAGDEATVTLVLTNSGLASAYDVEISDTVIGQHFNIATIAEVTTPSGFLFDVSGTPDATVTFRVDTNAAQPAVSVEPGESLSFSFTVDLAQTVYPNQTLTNLASISRADSIDGEPPAGVERDASGDEDFDTVYIPGLMISKSFVGTSENSPVDTTGTNVTMGESVRYQLDITLPESTITNLTVNDILPPGMRYVTNSVSVNLIGFWGAFDQSTPQVSTLGGPGDDVLFTFPGLTTVFQDNNAANNDFSMQLELIVLDVPGNIGLTGSQTILPNTAEIDYDGNPSNAIPSQTVNVIAVEPALEISKTLSGPSNGVVEVSLVVTNSGLATAFDVVLEDVFPTLTWDTTTLVFDSVPGFTNLLTGAPGDVTARFYSDLSSGVPTNSIEVGEVISFTGRVTLQPEVAGPITNRATITQHTTTDGPNPDERDEPDVEDDDVLPLPNFSVFKSVFSPSGRAAAVGEEIVFRITVTNDGALGFSTVALEDTFDNGILAYNSALPAEDSVAGNLISWSNVGPLPVGASTNIFVSFTALASTQPNLTTNTVVANLMTTNNLPLPPETNEAPIRVSNPAYEIVKDITSPSLGTAAQIGDAIVFSITVTNTGDVVLSTVPVEDTYDTSLLDFVSAVPPTVDNADDGVINWADVGPLPVGASTTLVVNFTAALSTLSLPETNVVVAAPTTPPTEPPVPPKTNDAPYEISRADYEIFKDITSPVLGTAAQIGDAIVFSITVTNTGDVVLSTVPVEDTYDTSLLDFVSAVPPTVNNTDDGVINWADVGPLSVGASTTLVVNFTAAASTFSLPETNVVVATPTTPPTEPPVPPKTNDAPYEAVVVGYTLEKTLVNPTNRPAIPGESLQFEITLVNTGQVNLATIPVVDVYETNTLFYVDAVPATDDSVNDGVIHWTDVGPLAVGASTTLVVNFTAVNGTFGAMETNGVVASPTTPPAEPPVPPKTNEAPYEIDLPVVIGDYVWNDLNANGIQDPADVTNGISGVNVDLYDSASNLFDSTTTDISGFYLFTNLPPADYFIKISPPTGSVVTPPNQGGDVMADSDIDTNTFQTALITLPSGSTNLTLDAGIYFPASLGDFVWLDVNGNGIQDAAETNGVEGVTVTLYDASTNALSTADTDANGMYAFTNLVPGTYLVGFEPLTGFWFTEQNAGGDDATDSDADPISGLVNPITLVSGENNPTLDAGLYVLGSLAGTVFHDENDDGNDQFSETTFPNVLLELTDTNGTVIATTYTDAFGNYLLVDLVPGDYVVNVVDSTVPAGFSIASNFTDPSAVQSLESGEDITDVDFGYLYSDQGSVVIGDYVWIDANGDGIQDPAEIGISGVELTLVDVGPDGIFGTADDLALATNETDGAGAYLFSVYPPATYVVVVSDVTGTAAEDLTAVSGPQSFTGQSAPISLLAGEVYLGADFGYTGGLLGQIGDQIWLDLDGNGTFDPGESPIANITVNLTDTNGLVLGTAVTDASGTYLFDGLPAGSYLVDVTDTGLLLADYTLTTGTPDVNNESQSDPYAVDLASGASVLTADFGYQPPPGSLGNLVFLDENADGIYSPADGDAGLAGVTVELRDGGGLLLDTQVTDANGNYLFTDLDAGIYQVQVDITSLPPGTTAGPLGTPQTDNHSQAQAYSITLATGASDLTGDFGYVRNGTVTIGDTVYWDWNSSGLQDTPLETNSGIANITLELYLDLNADGILDGSDLLVGTDTTDLNGKYLFENLIATNYIVHIVDPLGRLFGTTQTQGNVPQAVDVTDGIDDLDVDFGFVPSGDFGAIGDTVWVDFGSSGNPLDGLPNEDLSSTGLNGVIVTLYDGLGNLLDTRVTTNGPAGQRGYYLFDNLPFGEYRVDVDISTVPSQVPFNTTPLSTNANLTPLNPFLNADFGFRPSGSPTAVELTLFTASPEGDAVAVRWSTAMELNTLGFRLLRSDSMDGERQTVTPSMIYGRGSESGADYEWIDHSVEQAGFYVYWLEEEETDGDRLVYGPVAVRLDSGRHEEAFGRVRIQSAGLYRIGYETLIANGIAAGQLDVDRLQIWAGGRQVPLLISAVGTHLQTGDYLLFYLPEGVNDGEAYLAQGEPSLRMPWVFAAPQRGDGDVWAGVVGSDGTLNIPLSIETLRYFATGFTNRPVWLLDISDPESPIYLFGQREVMQGVESGIYFSLPEFAEESGEGYASDDEAVIDIEVIQPPGE